MERIPLDPSPLPVVAGRYRLLRRLAIGGMGELFVARVEGPEGLGRKVVLKRIRPELASEPSVRRRFEREARVGVGVEHPNVVKVLEVGTWNGELFLVMEYVEGCDLHHLLRALQARGERLELPLALFIGAELALGLHSLHTFTDPDGRPAGLVHRDVSPANVLLSRHGDVKLGDFGIARADAIDTATAATLTGGVVGKVHYLSPEQADRRPVGPPSDIFSLGVVLYEMLSGRRPFEGDTEWRVIERIVRDAPVPIEEVCPDLPPGLRALVHQCLDKDPARRPASAETVHLALLDIIASTGWTVSRRDLAAVVEAVVRDAAPAASLDEALALALPADGDDTQSLPGPAPAPSHPSEMPARTGVGSPPPSEPAPAPAASSVPTPTPYEVARAVEGVRRLRVAVAAAIAVALVAVAAVGALVWTTWRANHRSPVVHRPVPAVPDRAPVARQPKDEALPSFVSEGAARALPRRPPAALPLGLQHRRPPSRTVPRSHRSVAHDAEANPASATRAPAKGAPAKGALAKPSGILRFRYFPASAHAFVDGKPVRPVRSNIVEVRLPEGTHRVEVRAKDGRSLVREVVVHTGRVVELGRLEVRPNGG